MTRTMLQGAGLSSVYWSYALFHAVYIKNRLPRKAIPTTPFEAYTGGILDLKHLRVFGCFVTSKNPGERKTKLSKNVSHSIFLGYTATLFF